MDMSDSSRDDLGDETLDFGCLTSPEKSATEGQTSTPYQSNANAAASSARALRAEMADVDPVRVLQLSQNIFVSDSLDEDDDISVIIPPTPAEDTVPFIIPSTPPERDCQSPGDKIIDISMDEKKSHTSKQLIFDVDDDDDDDDDWTKPTQPILPMKDEDISNIVLDEAGQDNSDDETFADTEAMFASCMVMEQPQQSTPVSKEDAGQANSPDDDDDWNLRLTATQPTQPIETIALNSSNLTNKSHEDEPDVAIAELCERPKDVSDDKSYEEEANETSVIEEKETVLEKTIEVPQVTDQETKRDHYKRESTPESVRLFAEIENIVKAAGESEMKLVSESSNATSKDGKAEDVEESDDEEIAPSQTSSVSLSMSRKAKVSEEEMEVPLLVPDTDATALEESEGNHVDEFSADIPETEQLLKDPAINVIKSSPVKPSKKQSRLTKTQKKKETKKKKSTSSNSDSTESLTAKEISESQMKTLNGSSEQNITESLGDVFRPPRSYAKRTPRTPQKSKPVGKLITDFSPPSDLKPSDTTLTADSEEEAEKKHINFKQPRRLVGSFNDVKSLSRLLYSVGVSADEQQLKSSASLSNRSPVEKDIVRMRYRVYIKENEVYEEYMEEDNKIEISPMNSSSTTSQTASFLKLSSSTSTGEMGDISSSASLKSHSSNSSGTHTGTQDSATNFQTSTQNSSTPVLFHKRNFTIFPGIDKMSSQDDFKNPVVVLSPIKPDKKGIAAVSDSADSDVAATKSKRKKPVRKAGASKKKGEDSSEPEAKRTKRKSGPVDEGASTSTALTTKKGTAKKAAASTRKGGGRKGRKVKEVEANPESDSTAEEKPKPVVPQPISIEETVDPAPFGSILPGVRVMARWKDGYYYPGLVQSKEPDGRWAVEFDDGAVRIMTQTSLLKIALLQVGTKVLALSPDHYYDPGTVVSHYRDEDDMGYVVEQDSGLTRRYKRGSVILSTEQAKLITNSRPCVSPSLTINLDNIIGGKRKRKSSNHSDGGPPPSPPKMPKTRQKKNPDPNLDSTEASGNESTSSFTSKSKVVAPTVSPIEPASTETEATADDDDTPLATRQKQARGKGKKAAKKTTKKAATKSSRKAEKAAVNTSVSSATEDTSQTSSFSNVPSPDRVIASPDIVAIRSSKLFNGYAFILTHAVRKGAENTDASATTFDREYLCKIIIQGGGIVLESFEESQKCINKKVILLANSHLRTIKYLQCVAANIPCIQQYWVQTCSSSRKIVERGAYMLPTGYNIVEEKTVEWHGKTNIFKGLKIVITSEKKNDFVNIWTPVLLAAKAELVQKYNMPSFTIPGTAFHIDLIITNASCPANILTAAKKGKIPVVSSEYVIQCIIAGTRLPFNAHPKFKHDFKD